MDRIDVRLTNGKCITLQAGDWVHLKRQLLSGIGADLEILCQNGAKVKCHRDLLADWSQVFRNKLAELKPGCPLEMEDMSEDDVKVFLEYLYIKSESESVWKLSFLKGLDLMMTAMKYEIGALVQLMEKIILSKKETDKNYFSVDGAVNLYLFGRNLGKERLRDKAVCVIRNYLETEPEAVLRSEMYQNLFGSDAQAAIELPILLFSVH